MATRRRFLAAAGVGTLAGCLGGGGGTPTPTGSPPDADFDVYRISGIHPQAHRVEHAGGDRFTASNTEQLVVWMDGNRSSSGRVPWAGGELACQSFPVEPSDDVLVAAPSDFVGTRVTWRGPDGSDDTVASIAPDAVSPGRPDGGPDCKGLRTRTRTE